MDTSSGLQPPALTGRVAFIGGGHMAGALIGGLRAAGTAAADIVVVEPDAPARARLAKAHGVVAQPAADAALASAAMVVWAVKPQSFAAAAAPCAPHVRGALQVSVMAGVRCDRIAQAVWGDAGGAAAPIVRAMPNTPALIRQGITGLFATAACDAAARAAAQALFAPVGAVLWLDDETALDAVTALSGSGPAYVFFFLEAMERAAVEMGLSAEHGRALGQATFAGAAALAARSPLALAELRAQVTSKGGTTHAAITTLQEQGVDDAFVRALHAARTRAAELARDAG
jgi:pyrroline-5-carboxylate reductase